MKRSRSIRTFRRGRSKLRRRVRRRTGVTTKRIRRVAKKQILRMAETKHKTKSWNAILNCSVASSVGHEISIVKQFSVPDGIDVSTQVAGETGQDTRIGDKILATYLRCQGCVYNTQMGSNNIQPKTFRIVGFWIKGTRAQGIDAGSTWYLEEPNGNLTSHQLGETNGENMWWKLSRKTVSPVFDRKFDIGVGDRPIHKRFDIKIPMCTPIKYNVNEEGTYYQDKVLFIVISAHSWGALAEATQQCDVHMESTLHFKDF